MATLTQLGKNPNKYVRQAYVDALSSIAGVPVYDTAVPADVKPIPTMYIIIHDFTKTVENSAKCMLGWDVSVLLDLISIQPSGFVTRELVDDLEEKVINVILLQNEFIVNGFNTFSSELSNSKPMDVIMPTSAMTKNIIRTVLTYDHRLYESDYDPNAMVGYYGYLTGRTLPNQSQILSAQSFIFRHNEPAVIPFNTSQYSFLWFALPAGESIKNYYEDLGSPLNQAYIGTTSSLFGAKQTSGDFDVYVGNYFTVQNTSLRLKRI